MNLMSVFLHGLKQHQGGKRINSHQKWIFKTQSQALGFYLNQRIQQVTTSFIEYPTMGQILEKSKIGISATRGNHQMNEIAVQQVNDVDQIKQNSQQDGQPGERPVEGGADDANQTWFKYDGQFNYIQF
ncbi:MAG: hypothetical protein EZS28_007001 [Streblomastix strix]|uniref:Uncharacterized protein n=1 Tax=Streblomastix strix TaxID=222440 RepID=A0A5J4WSF7_9EUKA|nr:MAG: hypothetical protein EZS28_007001 [Streblomastix strix]